MVLYQILDHIKLIVNSLTEDIQDTIYEYKHRMKCKDVIHELHHIVYIWCSEKFSYRYCKYKHELMYRACLNEFKQLSDVKDPSIVNLKAKDIFDIMN